MCLQYAKVALFRGGVITGLASSPNQLEMQVLASLGISDNLSDVVVIKVMIVIAISSHVRRGNQVIHLRTDMASSSLISLRPLRTQELPQHPKLTNAVENANSTPSPGSSRPDLLDFTKRLLDSGAAFLSPPTFSSIFTSTSTKSSPPFKAQVALFKAAKPINDEPWFARRSRHVDTSSKTSPGTASWAEFVFGLRDEHSKHEQDFTPTLYDARHVLDWNEELSSLLKVSTGSTIEGFGYTSPTLSVFEMCHAIPAPLKPRCFPVLVCTASVSPTEFLAVTVPVDLSSPGLDRSIPFYSSKRNIKEGRDAQRKKEPVLGVYAAVETVRKVQSGEIEWTMATASDTKGSLPMWAQKLGIPGAIAKDVGFFMGWIQKVKVEDVPNQKG